MKPIHVGLAAPIGLQSLVGTLDGPLPTTDGFSAPVISELALALLDRGHRLTVYTMSPNDSDVGDFFGDRISVFVRPCRSRLRWLDAFRAERRALTEAMTTSTCDIMHAHWTYEFAFAALRSRLPTLVTVRDWAPEGLRYHRHPFRLVRLFMQRRVIRRAPFLIANSPYIAERIQRSFGRDAPVVPNGLAVPAISVERQPNRTVRLGALNSGFDVRKNVVTLLKAFARVRADVPDARLRLAGFGYGLDEGAHRWARANGLDSGVEFLGRLAYTDVPAFLQSLDLFVHPSLEESFGMVLIEALAQGTPVLAGSTSGAVPWVLGHGIAGTLADVTSDEALAKELTRLVDDAALLRSSAAAGLAHVRANFSLDHVVDLYEAEYARVLGLASR